METYSEAYGCVLLKCIEARELGRTWIEVQACDNWRGYKLISSHKRYKGAERVVVQDQDGTLHEWAETIVGKLVEMELVEPARKVRTHDVASIEAEYPF